jgi:hypothetical protein
MGRTARRILVLAAGVFAVLAIGTGARAQESPIPPPATTELAPVVNSTVDPGFERDLEVAADLYGVSWQGDPGATFAIETLEAEGWTPAQEVGSIEAESGPDPASAEGEATDAGGPYATEPLWSGDAGAVRVQLVSGTATEIQVIAVTSEVAPDASAADPAALAFGGSGAFALAAATLGTGASRRLRRGATVALVIAVAATGLVTSQDEARAGEGTQAPAPSHLIRRDEWGARKPQCDPGTFRNLHLGIVHHTAGSNNYGPGDGPSIVRGIQAYHMDLPGPDPYCDIAYNFLVDKYGNSYVGRAHSTRVHRPIYGAHTAGANKGSTGVSVLGNYETSNNFPRAARRAVADVLAWRFLRHGVNPLGVTGDGHERISGHRDFNSTACPGQQIYSRLGRIRNKTANKMS